MFSKINNNVAFSLGFLVLYATFWVFSTFFWGFFAIFFWVFGQVLGFWCIIFRVFRFSFWFFFKLFGFFGYFFGVFKKIFWFCLKKFGVFVWDFLVLNQKNLGFWEELIWGFQKWIWGFEIIIGYERQYLLFRYLSCTHRDGLDPVPQLISL